MNRLTDMEFDEISLVTRPANQLSKVVLYKSDTQEIDEVSVEKMHSKGKIKPRDDEDEEEMMEDSSEEEMMEDEEEESSKKKKNPFAKSDAGVIDLPQEVYEYITALEASNAEMSDMLDASIPEVSVTDDIMKSADPAIVALMKSFEDRATAAEAIAKSERDHRLERDFISKAASLTHLPVDTGSFGKILKGAADALTTEQFAVIWDALESANVALAESSVFAEVGKSGDFANDGAFSNIDRAAAKLMAKDPNLTREQAISKSVDENPSLYNEYLRGK